MSEISLPEWVLAEVGRLHLVEKALGARVRSLEGALAEKKAEADDEGRAPQNGMNDGDS